MQGRSRGEQFLFTCGLIENLRHSRGVPALLILAAFLAGASGCSADPAPVELFIGSHRFTVEIADTEESRARGLMFRQSLPQQHGMLFVFPDDSRRSFWMRDTSIPLSLAFIRRDGVITEIYDMQPFSLEPVNSVAEVRFALEVNQGEFRRLGIRPGDRVQLPQQITR